jgi:amino acid transporter
VHSKPTAYGAGILTSASCVYHNPTWYAFALASSFGTLVGATAIIPYIIYFLITVAYAVKRRTTDSLPGAFSLGRWAWPVIGFVLVYTVVIMVALSFP